MINFETSSSAEAWALPLLDILGFCQPSIELANESVAMGSNRNEFDTKLVILGSFSGIRIVSKQGSLPLLQRSMNKWQFAN